VTYELGEVYAGSITGTPIAITAVNDKRATGRTLRPGASVANKKVKAEHKFKLNSTYGSLKKYEHELTDEENAVLAKYMMLGDEV
jgi:hypothetical protein